MFRLASAAPARRTARRAEAVVPLKLKGAIDAEGTSDLCLRDACSHAAGDAQGRGEHVLRPLSEADAAAVEAAIPDSGVSDDGDISNVREAGGLACRPPQRTISLYSGSVTSSALTTVQPLSVRAPEQQQRERDGAPP